MLLIIESLLIVVAIILALVAPGLGATWFERAERALSLFARRRRLAVLSVGLLPLILRVALLPIFPIPEPAVHDEFGYLLAADTFAHGRLTNPTHPMWVHFETFSIIQKPTYQCYAQPAQGMILAAGKLILGHPFWGVWFSTGVMCAAICWMLQGWLPASWALLGGLVAVLRFGVFGYWADSYWGGAAGAIGGTLVLGVLPRIKHLQRTRDAVLMGVGLGILANSRPYEGFFLSLPIAVSLLIWMLRAKRPPAILLRRVVVPLGLLLALTAVTTGYYCWRVTGSPFRMSYQVEADTYSAAPLLVWQSPWPKPTYHHTDLENVFVGGELTRYRVAMTPLGFLYLTCEKAVGLWRFFLGPALTVPIVMLGFSTQADHPNLCREARFLLIVFALTVACLLSEIYFSPHYAAPATTVILGLVLLPLRELRSWQFSDKKSGLFLARAIIVICAAMFAVRCLAGTLHFPITRSNTAAWYQDGAVISGRIEILARLREMPGSQLVIVKYKPHRVPDNEWVYNEADIDNSKIVWARDMGVAQNEELLKYFNQRKRWLLRPDEDPPLLVPYFD